MIIKKVQGDIYDGDKRLLVTTNNEELLTMFKLAFLINQFGINEKGIRDYKGYKHNYFSYAIKEALDMASNGVDWNLSKNRLLVVNYCKTHHINLGHIGVEKDE